jgi:hypothetical protein
MLHVDAIDKDTGTCRALRAHTHMHTHVVDGTVFDSSRVEAQLREAVQLLTNAAQVWWRGGGVACVLCADVMLTLC